MNLIDYLNKSSRMVGEELVIFLSRFFEKVSTKKSYWNMAMYYQN